MTDQLEALERRGDELEQWHSSAQQASAYLNETGSDHLVKELRQARTDHRLVRLGTINTLILLDHIDRLEAELGPLQKP